MYALGAEMWASENWAFSLQKTKRFFCKFKKNRMKQVKFLALQLWEQQFPCQMPFLLSNLHAQKHTSVVCGLICMGNSGEPQKGLNQQWAYICAIKLYTLAKGKKRPSLFWRHTPSVVQKHKLQKMQILIHFTIYFCQFLLSCSMSEYFVSPLLI